MKNTKSKIINLPLFVTACIISISGNFMVKFHESAGDMFLGIALYSVSVILFIEVIRQYFQKMVIDFVRKLWYTIRGGKNER